MVFDKGQKFIKKDGSEVDAEPVVKGAEVVLVYFSAHWCPPCRNFTPVLAECYKKVEEQAPGTLAIIFVSSDRGEEDMLSYFTNDHGDYYALPHGCDAGNTLKKNCQVSGIPSLCLVDKDGKMIYQNVRNEVTSKEPMKVVEFLKAKLK